MTECIIVGVLVCVVFLWLYCCYKDITSDKREKKAIDESFKDAGYVQRQGQAERG